MKTALLSALFLIFGILFSACGGGGGGGGGTDGTGSSGSLKLAITDAKPALPPGIVQVLVTIDEVSVHQSGGEWTSLTLAQTPFTIDLLRYSDGNTTQLVPQTTLASGKYTQIRLGVHSAMVVTDTGAHYPVEIPSGNLKTDKNFDFTVAGGGAVALTVDFDLSQSLVATGSHKYKLKPVLHIVSTAEAASVTGSISAATFGTETEATIIVTQDNDNSGTLTPGDEEYTRLIVTKGTTDPTAFTIYWLVPDLSYIVDIQIAGVSVYTEAIAGASLPAAAVFPLNSGNPI